MADVLSLSKCPSYLQVSKLNNFACRFGKSPWKRKEKMRAKSLLWFIALMLVVFTVAVVHHLKLFEILGVNGKLINAPGHLSGFVEQGSEKFLKIQ